eukprot:TRINITY_DN82016_c0_g1_i1.p1 TRINITY_DN82016_c0_g1~~TRINITY_DN82016_c0_g1_i1.p1  ORF type:complete len:682 (+),score=218.29 TRINITY_DN82016_c0_g1_i1:51-2096(+)
MKSSIKMLLALFLAAVVHVMGRPSPMARVVQLLEDMGDKAKEDAKAELEMFEKFECYCSDTTKETRAKIEGLSQNIDSTQNSIEKLSALVSELTAKEEQLQKDIQAKKDSQAAAVAIRQKEKDTFLKEEGEHNSSIESLETAIGKLETTPDTAEATALLGKTKTISKLSASISFLAPKASAAFLSLDGKTSQPQELLQVLKQTLTSYIESREELRRAEQAAQTTSDNVIARETRDEARLSAMLESTQQTMATSDEETATKKKGLETLEADLANAEDVLASTEENCAQKKKVIEQKKMLRAQEAAAIAKALAVLNNDAAFEAFQNTKTTGTKALSLISKDHAIRRHDSAQDFRHHSLRKAAQLLHSLAHETGSSRLTRVAAFTGENPFAKVLEEISDMKNLIQKEAAADKKKWDWCAKEKSESEATSATKDEMVTALEASLDEFKKSLENPSDGLLVTLQTAEADLKENQQNQAKETKLRKEENTDYQKNIATLQQTQTFLEQGTAVLKNYYDSIPAGIAFMQKRKHGLKREEPASAEPPGISEEYTGQSQAGSEVLALLGEIMEDTKSEEKEAHKAESDAQLSFEDSMTALTKEEDTLEITVADTNKQIAATNTEIDSKEDELAVSQKAKASTDAYLKNVVKQCEFINTNFDKRESARAKETAGLEKAEELLRGSGETADD